ncbi:MAG: NfeD family protein [Tissierellia bacterium]|nr:NfeD family protein [Tissierellia bacterium]MDD4725540.1 NfeD family protein [Tissierellia bacterium]
MKYRKIGVVLILLLILSSVSYANEVDNSSKVYIVPINGEINRATSSFVKNTIESLEQKNAEAIIFEINTYGGLIDEAIEIKDAILDTNIPTISYVKSNAQSAGVLITIASEKVVMANSATIGSAETIPNTEKIMSMWRAVLRDTAQYRDRDYRIIEAMADKDIKIDGITKEGKLVNLTSNEALEYGIADNISNDYNSILDYFKIEASGIIEVEEGFKVKLAKYISSSTITTMLLAIGFIGVAVEILTPGFGIGGIASIMAFGLYFGGNILAGNSNWISLTLFVIGLILLVIEGMVPGFGLPGIGGIVFIVVGTIMAMNDFRTGVLSLSIAIILTTIVTLIFVKLGYRSKIFDNIILSNELVKERGYIPSNDMEHLLGEEGITLSELRPAGFIEINGNKYDVLSEGDFISKNANIKVVKVEGSKIFVRRT